MKKIIYSIFVLFLVFVLLINILSMLNVSVFKIRLYKVGSGSMEPILKVNDIILVKENDEYQPNDIVTFIDEQKMVVTHRIIIINDEEIITKGDANNDEDKPIKKEMIIGKMIFKFRLFGYLNYLLSLPFTWILLFVIGISVVFLTSHKKTE